MKAINLEKLLPEDIPAGERVLWHGRPEWKSLARRGFRVDIVAIYFAAAAAWNFASTASEAGMADASLAAAKTLAVGLVAVSMLGFLAWLSSRTTLYVVTSRRVILKIGIALQVFFNLPYSQIAAAHLAVNADGTGDIPLALTSGQRIAYLHLWPHARPFHFAQPEPTLRCVPNVKAVAEILGRALIAAANERPAADVTASGSTVSGSDVDLRSPVPHEAAVAA